MDLPQILGRNVRYWRKLRGLSQEVLAFETDMKRSYVSDIERGNRNPTIKALARLAIALKVEPEALVRKNPP
jgi:transcriptional regulator with XRE-family HTH domain